MNKDWTFRILLLMWNILLLLFSLIFFQFVHWILSILVGSFTIAQLVLLVTPKPMEMVFFRLSKEDENP
jgi:hypothetical protein